MLEIAYEAIGVTVDATAPDEDHDQRTTSAPPPESASQVDATASAAAWLPNKPIGLIADPRQRRRRRSNPADRPTDCDQSMISISWLVVCGRLSWIRQFMKNWTADAPYHRSDFEYPAGRSEAVYRPTNFFGIGSRWAKNIRCGAVAAEQQSHAG